MADNMIELVASLNVSDSAEQINKVDIPLLQDKIKGIKIKCELDTDGISSIQSQLANIKINAPQIDLGVGGGSGLINNVSYIVDNVEGKIEELRKNLAEKFGVSVDEIVTNTIKNAKGQINSFSFDLTKLSGEVEKFSYKVSHTKQKDKESGKDYTVTSVKAIGSRDSDKGAIQLLERATKAANTLERQMINLKAAADDVSAPRPITSQESIDKVAQAYKNAETAVGNLRTANASTFEELNNEAKKAVDELNNVIKAQRNADTAATKLRAKPIEVVKADELSNLDKFVATISNSAIPDVTNLTQRVEELRSELSEVNDKQGLVDYLNKFANVESDFKALVAQAKAVKGALRDLDNLSNNSLFQKNKSDPQVSSTLSDIEDIRKEYGQLFAEIGNAKTPEDLQKISNKLAELKPQFDKVVNSANQFKTALKAENIDAGLANRIKRLTADINSYAAANKRAVESTKQMASGRSFADEWSRITSVMAKGVDLTDGELKDLSTDMAVFRKEAQAAGLAGASAFEKFANSFKVISTYISANQLVNMVIRNIRSAITELQTVDDILTEISKTSDRTETSLRKLGETSYDSASKYGRVASDYLLGIQEMSRAGFNETQSENLAELSILAQAAGDMTAEMANEYIIATNAAYSLEGSEEKLNQILDSQNYITNHNALNMENLAQATKVAASQASASGVAIDELTAAVGTMVATTQQGGDVAGRAFKGILMNIQQVKASASDIGDGGEDITTESLSKYEAATKALGVSLTEVRNGVTQLREPMEVLKELSIAVRKESEGSIKVANLVSAVGGKFRGNQLIALLQNWDTYEKMLSEFNSNEAMGSAMQEAEKSANNWSGSLNKVKNSWDELVNSFIDSDNAVDILQSVNTIIQNLTDSAATGTLKTLADTLANIVRLISDITNKVGTLPVLLTGIVTAKGGLFGDTIKSSLSGILTSLKSAKGSIGGYSKSLDVAKIKTVALDVATKALDTTLTFGLSIAISFIISQISKWINAQKEEEEAQEELRRQYKETAEEYDKNSKSLDEVIERYSAIVSSTNGVISSEKSLSSLQDELTEKFGEKAEALDLVNQKYSEGIEKIKEMKLAEAEEYVEKADRTDSYKTAKERLETSYKVINSASKGFYDTGSAKMTAKGFGGWDFTRESVKQLSEFQNIYWDGGKTGYGNVFRVTGTLEEQKQTLEDIADIYKLQEDYDERRLQVINKEIDRLDEEIAQYKQLVQQYEAAQKTIAELKLPEETKQQFNELLDKAYEYNQIALGDGTAFEKAEAVQNLADLQEEMYTLVGQNQEYRTTIRDVFAEFVTGSQIAGDALENIGAAWYETLDGFQKGAVSNVDKMKKAMQTLSEGGTLSASDFWALEQLDTSHILSNIEEVDGEFRVSLDSMQNLKDSYIQTQVAIVQGWIDAAKAAKEAQDAIIESNTRKLQEWKFSEKSLLDPKYRAEYERLETGIATARDLSAQYGETIKKDELLIRQLNGSLGYTVDKQKQLTQLANDAQAKADNLLKAYEYRIDQIVDGFEEEKEAIEASRDALQDQLTVLEEQQKAIQETIDRYETAADVVADAIQAQIDALKEQNEEREEALDLAEKLANLENAKNNKVRTYTEAGGWQYEAKKSDVDKAQREVDKAQANQDIKVLEEYLKQWEGVTQKRQKAEDEQLAEQILGADWRQKIAKQDEGIFNKYEEEYESYGSQLNRISNVEMQTLQKEIDIKNKEISAKEAQIKEWQKYKSAVQKAANDAKAATSDWYQYLSDITLNEDSTLDERNRNLEEFASTYGELVETIAGYTSQIGDMSASISFDTSGLRDAAKELEEFFNAYREGVMAMADAYNADDNHFGLINSEWDAKLLKAAKGMQLVHSAATGRVVDYTGLLAVHGTKQKSETIFNANDSKKLYDYIHNTPNVMADMITGGFKIAQNLPKTNNATSSNAVTFNGTTINLPNVQNAEQFARQMESYMQTVLTESQVFKPRR